MGKTQIKKAVQRDDEDYALVKQALGRSTAAREAFGRLTLKYQDRIYNALLKLLPNREDALDLAQETFLRAFKALRNFKGKSKFSTWLWAIALNLRTSKWRMKRASKRAEGLSVGSTASGENEPDSPTVEPVASNTDPSRSVETKELNKAYVTQH